jgi:hypothetical protein
MNVVLRNELLTDPLSRGYAAMSDGAAAYDLNTLMRDVRAFVTVDQLRQYLIGQIDGAGVDQRSSLDMIREFAEAGTVRGVAPPGMTAGEARQSGCNMIWYMLQYGQPDSRFLVDESDIEAQFLAIGPDAGDGPTVLTNGQLLDIQGMATTQVSRAQEIGVGTVSPGDVQKARA